MGESRRKKEKLGPKNEKGKGHINIRISIKKKKKTWEKKGSLKTGKNYIAKKSRNVWQAVGKAHKKRGKRKAKDRNRKSPHHSCHGGSNRFRSSSAFQN